MTGNLDYIKNLKNQTQKKKSITITIDENTLDKISEIADKLEISKNQIISDISSNFVNDYLKIETPNYYIVNSNNAYMPYGHLHMLLGNRASAWGDTKSAIEGLEPGDYIFIYMNEKGIIASGTVKSKYIVNDYSLFEYFTNNDGTETDYDVWDEYFVHVEFDKKALKYDESNETYIIEEGKVIKASEYRDNVSNKPLGRTKLHLTKEEGDILKKIFLEK